MPITRMSDLLPRTAPAKPDFFVDLDGTLKTHHDGEGGTFQVTADWGLHTYDPRPGYREFLSALAGMGRVSLSTAGGGRYAATILKQMGIESFFARKFTATSWRHGIPYSAGAIFIDDDPYMARDKVRCMHWTGLPPGNDELDERIVVVPAYWGGPDNALQAALADVRAAVERVCGGDQGAEGGIIIPDSPGIILPDET